MTTQTRDQYLDYLIDSSIQGVNRFFVLSFEDNAHRIRHTEYFKVEIGEQNVIPDEQNFLIDQ